jgi:hypothetical protein
LLCEMVAGELQRWRMLTQHVPLVSCRRAATRLPLCGMQLPRRRAPAAGHLTQGSACCMHHGLIPGNELRIGCGGCICAALRTQCCVLCSVRECACATTPAAAMQQAAESRSSHACLLGGSPAALCAPGCALDGTCLGCSMHMAHRRATSSESLFLTPIVRLFVTMTGMHALLAHNAGAHAADCAPSSSRGGPGGGHGVCRCCGAD